jgi:hypothetical protein
MDIFTTGNPETKCTVCGNNTAPNGKATLGILIPTYNIDNQDDRTIEALFIHIECLDLLAVRMFGGIMLAQKIEEDKSAG